MATRQSAHRVAPKDLADQLIARGVHFISLADAAELMHLEPNAAADAMVRLKRAAKIFSPAPGLYVPIGPEYRSWRVVPAMDFIDPMMNALGRSYYVGLLSAAEIHGAAHQRPQVFQVMVDDPVRNRDLGRIRLRFYTHKHLGQVPTVLRNSLTGQVRVSSPETTAFDLVSRAHEAGGLDNVATVLAELALDARLNIDELLRVSQWYPTSALRRLGWLLERTEAPLETERLAAHLRDVTAEQRPVTLLDRSGPRRGHGNHRWGIVENVDVEPDL
jgi:predicted transcriptional regulator of viral defense system